MNGSYSMVFCFSIAFLSCELWSSFVVSPPQKLIRMNMPVAADGTVHFSTTLLALVRESLEIRMGPGLQFLHYIVYLKFTCPLFVSVLLQTSNYIMFNICCVCDFTHCIQIEINFVSNFMF